MLTTDIERKGSTTVLRCEGRIVVGEELSKLRDAVLCELDKQTIVLDLAAVEVIDAGGAWDCSCFSTRALTDLGLS